jgi:hypothetical protein
MERKDFIKTAGITAGMMAVSPFSCATIMNSEYDFPLTDLHVHTATNFGVEQIIEISRKSNVQFGIVVNPGYGVNDDRSLKNYIDKLRPYPVYIGMQPMTPGWSSSFSTEMINQLDYILMDAQTIPYGNGYDELLRIWNFDTYIDDQEKFMNVYMSHILEIINGKEPVTIFGWPLFLPVCIARDYYTLWTEERMQKIIAALKGKKMVVEINDIAHTPHEKFINMAKEQGLKFSFGSDTRDRKAGRLDYCKYVAKKCNLKAEDFWVPKRVLPKK